MKERCVRPGCPGLIVAEACTVCGRAPVGTYIVPSRALSPQPAPTVTRSAPPRFSPRLSQIGDTLPEPEHSEASDGSGGAGRRGSRGGSRRLLGAGLVNLEPLPLQNPSASVLSRPVVPESRRYCSDCDSKLYQEQGRCYQCGAEFCFVPVLQPGDLVAGQYKVEGAMAFGGVGWIYLAWDLLLCRWVVLKGLLNSKDERGAQAAVAERQFLAAVKHSNIVGVYNFVTWRDDGFIVMEYVGGKTLRTLKKEKGVLSAAEATAYIHRILRAFAYLHERGLLYCDFKPENFMLEGDDVKLIDMGSVRRWDDTESPLFGTVGYMAPEVYAGPSRLADLYTVGRTLAVLILDFDYRGSHQHSLPEPSQTPVLARYPSLARFLVKATHPEPERRFQTADEMADQLLGVLREIVTLDGQPSRPVESSLFTAEIETGQSGMDGPDLRFLPRIKPDPADPASGLILGTLSLSNSSLALERLSSAFAEYPDSVELPLHVARLSVEQGRTDQVPGLLEQAVRNGAFVWQTDWTEGIRLLGQRRSGMAAAVFDRLFSEAPGELAPKLGLAVALEMEGRPTEAARIYRLAACAEPGVAAAAFGLARCLAATGHLDGAIQACLRVPITAPSYRDAQRMLALLVAEYSGGSLRIEQLQLAFSALETAVRQVENGLSRGDVEQLMGCRLDSRSLRLALERELRTCAVYARTPEEKIALIDAANRERPATWF